MSIKLFSIKNLIHKKMELGFSHVWHFALMSVLLVGLCSLADCYDPLDPTGNITVTFDITGYTDDGYEAGEHTLPAWLDQAGENPPRNRQLSSCPAGFNGNGPTWRNIAAISRQARVTIQNFYQYRHVDTPGWTLGWTWTKNEVIWSMTGAFATKQGNCTAFRHELPHCCRAQPEIVDLMPGSPQVNMSENCCRGGLLTAWGIDPSMSFSSFLITVGNLGANVTAPPPANLTLLGPDVGYTCGPVLDAKPTVSSDIGGRREVQVYRTWKSTCTYSSFLANKTPLCCVSLSTFYSPTITSCPKCSCGCRSADKNTDSCISEGSSSSLSNADIVRCTDHMCPIRVHWHIKTSYMEYWRVKLTVSNYNYKRNYSDWNVVVQHPGFGMSANTFSFNSTTLPSSGFSDDVMLFWGISYFNTELLHARGDDLGSVSSEILMRKDLETFTFSNGWGLPRRIYFNGDNCEMPLPDSFPMLPNESSFDRPIRVSLLLLLMFLVSTTL